MRIDVYSDTVCPWCFIGKRRLERALAKRPGLQVELRWRAFLLNPAMPSHGLDRKTYLALKFGGSERASHLYDMIAEAGRSSGIDFNFNSIQRTPSTVDSHRLVMFASSHGRCETVVESLFRAYFLYGIDIGNRERLVEIGLANSLPEQALRDYLASEADIDTVRAQDLRARRMGIDGVPCFVFNDRYALAGAQEAEAFLPLLDVAALQPAAAE